MSRLIFKAGAQASNDVQDILQALFAMEFVTPGGILWLSSPWISDIPIIDNRADEFTALVPEWPATRLTLTSTLAALALRDCDIRITMRPDEHGERLVRQLMAAADRYGCHERIHVRHLDTKHGKGVLTRNAYLSGSMNITFNGIQVNEEDLRFDTDMAMLATAELEFAKRWQALSPGQVLP